MMEAPDYIDGRPVFRLISSYESRTVDWLSRGRLARGKLTDLSGPGGGGKSSVIIEWIARITTGLALPDGEAHPPAGVVLVANEDDPSDTLRPRLQAAGADLDRVLILDAEAGAIPYLPDGVADYEAACEAVGAALFVLDPVTNVLDSRLNHHKDSDVRAALMPLVAMLRRQNVAGVNIRHVNKTMSSDPATRGSGSIAFLNVARIGLLLAPDPEDSTRIVMAPTKANLARWPKSLAFSHESVPGMDVARVRWHGETDTTAVQLLTATDPEERGQRADARSWLEEFLAGGMQLTKDVYAEGKKQGLSESTLRRAKGDLRIKPIRINKPGSSLGEWYWSLKSEQGAQPPTQESQGDQGDQHMHVGNVEHLDEHLARRRGQTWSTGTEDE